MNQLVRFDNSLKEIVSNSLKPQRRMQQDSSLHALFLINDFHSKLQLNKAEHNKKPPIASNLLTILKELNPLSREDSTRITAI